MLRSLCTYICIFLFEELVKMSQDWIKHVSAILNIDLNNLLQIYIMELLSKVKVSYSFNLKFMYY